MIVLPKRVWLVILLLTLAVVSLWLMFLKRELRQEQNIATPLKQILGSNHPEANSALQQTQEFLDKQFDRLDQALRATSSISVTTLNNSIATSSVASTSVK